MDSAKRPLALGITGCIGAYKAAELLRRLQKRGYDVYPMLTAAAQKFVTPYALQTLSGRPAITSLWNEGGNVEVEHIAISDSVEALLVAPATANTIAKFANGIADDFLSTFYLSCECPVIIAPAMNAKMWRHPATVRNIDTLKRRGAHFINPESGWLACGWEGDGRLADLDVIVEHTDDILYPDRFLSGKNVLISAGPTREPIDPMRFISNFSSGKMGAALATMARKHGAQVTLVHGPIEIEVPLGVSAIPVMTAEEMHENMVYQARSADVIIMSAAVADYKPQSYSREKMKKDDDSLSIELSRTKDILSELTAENSEKLIVGFAAETENLRENALEKLSRKNLDLIIANSIAKEDGVAGRDNTAGLIINRHGRERGVGESTKLQMAGFIFEEIKELLENPAL